MTFALTLALAPSLILILTIISCSSTIPTIISCSSTILTLEPTLGSARMKELGLS